ncbi:MAG: signal peptidase I [Anaerolineales bacterium]|jgi:signal peptidase I
MLDNLRTEEMPEPPDPNFAEVNSLRRFLLDLLETILLAVVLFIGINAISARIRVESISMQPTLYEGDFVIVNKLAYKLGTPSRGDIIIFHAPPDPTGEPYIKRVIGLPGDTIEVKGGAVYINGEPLREPYIKAAPNYQKTFHVPADSLFVLGDNRNNSSDSHSWGPVPIHSVIGKAEVVYLPFNHWQVLNEHVAAAAGPVPEPATQP